MGDSLRYIGTRLSLLKCEATLKCKGKGRWIPYSSPLDIEIHNCRLIIYDVDDSKQDELNVKANVELKHKLVVSEPLHVSAFGLLQFKEKHEHTQFLGAIIPAKGFRVKWTSHGAKHVLEFKNETDFKTLREGYEKCFLDPQLSTSNETVAPAFQEATYIPNQMQKISEDVAKEVSTAMNDIKNGIDTAIKEIKTGQDQINVKLTGIHTLLAEIKEAIIGQTQKR